MEVPSDPVTIQALPPTNWDENLLGEGAPPIRLPVFEGPLDLLLFLIRKNEIDIYDIPIEQVTRQYLEVIHAMERFELEVVGEFLVMAATLMEIKSRMLLPRPELTEEEEEEEMQDPRWELVGQLLEYRQFKDAANELEASYIEQQSYYARNLRKNDLLAEERPLKSIDRIELWDTFNFILRRLSETIAVGEIEDEQITVADRMQDILELLPKRRQFRFTDLFTGTRPNLIYIVATFLAVLELTRLHKLNVEQDEDFSDILCTAYEEEQPPSSVL